MLRRIGYGLGLLFVLACVAAYPLTWERGWGIDYGWPSTEYEFLSRRAGLAVTHGQLWVEKADWVVCVNGLSSRRWRNWPKDDFQHHYSVQLKHNSKYASRSVAVP